MAVAPDDEDEDQDKEEGEVLLFLIPEPAVSRRQSPELGNLATAGSPG